MELLILTFVTLYLGLAWRRLELALAFLIFALPLYQVRFQVGPIPSTLLEVMVLILFIAWLVKAVLNKEIRWPFSRKQKFRQVFRHYPFYIEIILILIISFISIITAGSGNASFGIFKAYFLESIMFFIVFINIFKIKKNRKYIFWALGLSALVVSIIAIYQKITGQFLPVDWQETGRVTGPFPYPNALGLYLGPIILILIGRLLISLRNIKYLVSNKLDIRYWILDIITPSLTILLSLVSIFFAKSEGALAGILAALFIMGFLYNKLTRRIAIGLLLVIILTISLSSLRGPVIKKITLMDLDGQIRRQQWSETWQFLTNNPKNFIFGAGLANYQNAIISYHKSGIYVRNDDLEFDKWVAISLEYQQKVWQPLEIYLYPHNIVLNFWTELGLLGMLVFVWLMIKFLVSGIRYQVSGNKYKVSSIKYKEITLGLVGAMIVIVVHGLVDVPYFKNDLVIIFWLLIGMLGVYNLQISQSHEKNLL